MANSKWIVRSKTIIGALLMMLPQIITIAGYDPPTDGEMQTLTDNVMAWLDTLNEIVGFLLILWGRYSATQPVTLLPKPAAPGDGPTLRTHWVVGMALSVLALLMLAACTTPARIDPVTGQPVAVDPAVEKVKQAGITCSAYASTLTALAGLNKAGRLSPEQVARVDTLVDVAGPLCGSPIPPTMDQATLDSIDAAVWEMIQMEKATNGTS